MKEILRGRSGPELAADPQTSQSVIAQGDEYHSAQLKHSGSFVPGFGRTDAPATCLILPSNHS